MAGVYGGLIEYFAMTLHVGLCLVRVERVIAGLSCGGKVTFCVAHVTHQYL